MVAKKKLVKKPFRAPKKVHVKNIHREMLETDIVGSTVPPEKFECVVVLNTIGEVQETLRITKNRTEQECFSYLSRCYSGNYRLEKLETTIPGKTSKYDKTMYDAYSVLTKPKERKPNTSTIREDGPQIIYNPIVKCGKCGAQHFALFKCSRCGR